MRCFITGATGQLGSALIRALAAAGHELTALVLPDDPWAEPAFESLEVGQVTGDVREPSSLPDGRFDWVFHLAADQSFWRRQERRQRALNIDGVRNLLAWAQCHLPARLVHVSSLIAVGVAAGPDRPMDEQTPFNGDRLGLMYAQSKHAGERLVGEAAAQGLPAVIVNPGTIVGPWDRGRHALRMLRPFAFGLVRGVPRGGNNLVDVRDVAQGAIGAATGGRTGERYLLTGHNLSYRQLADALCRVAGLPPPSLAFPNTLLRLLARALDPVGLALHWMPPFTPDDVTVGTRFLYFDNSKARRELGFAVRPLDETLTDAVGWYREHGLWR